MTDDADRRLIDAIHQQRLGATAAAIDDEPSLAAAAACRRIASEIAAGRERLAALLLRHGIEIPSRDAGEFAQRHVIEIALSRDDARQTADVLCAEGFLPHPQWTGGAERSFWATADELTLTRTERWTTVVRLRWDGAPDLPRLLRPRPTDWAAIDLPGWAWWAYPLVRPVRLLLERVGIGTRDHAALEPFLATPTSLIAPLLDLADVDASDVVADIGCGDGRILIEAAQSRGCRAIGAEYSPELVAAARLAADTAGLADRVDIVEGDGLALPLDEVTVVLLFLPMVVASRVVPALLDRLPPGARVVTHEQSPLPQSLPSPSTSRALIGTDAVSVGHRWDVSAPLSPCP